MRTAIKNNVDRLLDGRGWTLYRLSKESGVSMTVIYNLDKKKSGPTANTLVKMADALGCTVDEIVR